MNPLDEDHLKINNENNNNKKKNLPLRKIQVEKKIIFFFKFRL
jgi:hypothetical protein